MMRDIVERLRGHALRAGAGVNEDCAAAADEITALSARIAELEASLAAIMECEAWQPIETMPDDFEGEALLFGKRYGDTIGAVKLNDDEIMMLSHHYIDKNTGFHRFASNETYYTDEVWYVLPSLWKPIPAPPKEQP